jgi:hypothetical protein
LILNLKITNIPIRSEKDVFTTDLLYCDKSFFLKLASALLPVVLALNLDFICIIMFLSSASNLARELLAGDVQSTRRR